MPPKQLTLTILDTTKEDSATRIGKDVFQMILHAKASDPNFKLTETTLVEVLRPALQKEYPKGKIVRRRSDRDPIFDAIAATCGISLAVPITRGLAAQIALARRDIVEAVPDIKPKEIERRARLYLAKYALPHCTPRGLAAHFSEFPPIALVPPKPDIYMEPVDWRERVVKLEFSPESTAQLIACEWKDLSPTIRQQILDVKP